MARILWYLRRLRTMSLKEIFTMRVYRFLRDRLIGSPRKIPGNLSLDLPGFPPEQKSSCAARFPLLQESLREEAQRILAHKIRIFGEEVSFPGEIDWNKDFKTGMTWPKKRIDYHRFQAGDPKDIWELNRQQDLPVLGKAFYLTGDERYAQKALAFIDSWIEQNPPSLGINWSSGIELSLRMISWIWTLRLIAASESLSPGVRQKITVSLFRQAHHIMRHLSLFSSANNHLIAEIAAAAISGMIFHQEKWSRKALARLEAEIDRQLLPDGVGAEQSIFYQAHVMEYYLLVAFALRERGLAVPERIVKGLHRGSVFLEAMLDDRGFPPHIGDNDSGEVLRLAGGYSNFKTLLNLASLICGEPGLLQEDVEQDEKAFWLIGLHDFELLSRTVGRKRKSISRSFPDGGIYILENAAGGMPLKLIFDCGPLGMKPLAGHGHADALSFVLYVDHDPVFIDSGTYTYFQSDFWRNYFRGTSAHNTIRLDGRDQSEFAGKFLAVSQARARCLEWQEPVLVKGEHDGYAREKNPAWHQRTVSLDETKPTARIMDILKTSGPHLVEQFFHLDHRSLTRRIGRNEFEIITPAKKGILRLDDSLEATVYHGDEKIPLGWQSTSFGHKDKAFSIVGRRRIDAETTLITQIIF